MIIRALTAAEEGKCQKARLEANRRIRTWRDEMIKQLEHKYARKADREQKAVREFPLITGAPVRVTDGENSMLLDYGRLWRFCWKLQRPGWTVTGRITKIDHDKLGLDLEYAHKDGRQGHLRMYELPRRHMQALDGLALPTVEIAQAPVQAETAAAIS